MSVPDEATLQELIDEGADTGFLTGTAAIDLAAITVAWELAEAYVGTNLLTGTACAEMHWPDGWADFGIRYKYAPLPHTRIISIDSLTTFEDDCDCDDPGDLKILDARRGIIQFCACARGNCGACNSLCGINCQPWTGRVEVCYTCGIWNNLGEMPLSAKSALWLLASWYANLFATGGADAGSGFINSWRSMDYNESYGFLTSSILGSSPQANAAWVLLRQYRVMRAVALRGWFPTKSTTGPPSTMGVGYGYGRGW